MSVKQALHQAVDSLPESVTLEEAFERLLGAFRLKQSQLQDVDPLSLVGLLRPREGRHVSVEEMDEAIRRRGAGG